MIILRMIFLLLLVFSETGVVNADSLNQWYENNGWILEDEYDHYPTSDEIEKMLLGLNKQISLNSSNPIFWYTKGVLVSLEQGNYHKNLLKEGQTYRLNAPENQALIKEYQSYYRTALDLNKAVDAPEHLTAEMLSTMADDVLAAPDIKERAYRKVIALIQAGKSDVDYENYEYETYQFLLESYSAQENPEKYLATLNEMIDRFGSTEELEGYKQHVEALIAQQQKQTAAQDVYAQVDTYTAPKAVAVQQLAQQVVEPKKVEAPNEADKTSESDNNTMLWWLLGGGALLLGLIVLMRRKQS